MVKNWRDMRRENWWFGMVSVEDVKPERRYGWYVNKSERDLELWAFGKHIASVSRAISEGDWRNFCSLHGYTKHYGAKP